VIKFIVLLLLFVPALSTPSLAQQCIADTIASVTADEYFLNSGAVYRQLPVDAGDIEFTTEDDYVPYKDKGDLIFTCGDHVLLLVNDTPSKCVAGEACKGKYFVVPVVCLRRCLATTKTK
jgi:hypothetical protein